uniref:Amidase domain-containing protein n=1 Tax=Podarcis muralis TaxID=64176 RepID=A0A670IJH5_PODMU
MIHEWLKQSWPQVKIDLHIVLALTSSTAAAFLAFRWMGQNRIKKQIQEARRKRDHGLGQMEKVVQEFKQQNPGVQAAHVLSLPLAELVEKLKEGSLSPESVLYTYMEKALAVHQEVNCMRHFIPECEQHLQELKKQKERGLLYGVPVSIKDHIAYKGHLSTCGLVQSLGALAEEDSVLVEVLKRQGANPFVITNVPQSLLNYDCSNSTFGQTVNPRDHKRGPGGSSGGEGALIASGGSILGFGSDLGGSIRLPSSFCGLCGLKPTAGRLSDLHSKIVLMPQLLYHQLSFLLCGAVLIVDMICVARLTWKFFEIARSLHLSDPHLNAKPFLATELKDHNLSNWHVQPYLPRNTLELAFHDSGNLAEPSFQKVTHPSPIPTNYIEYIKQ